MSKPSYKDLLATNKELVANNEELKNTITALNNRLKKEMKPTNSNKFKDIYFNAGMWFKGGKAFKTREEALNG